MWFGKVFVRNCHLCQKSQRIIFTPVSLITVSRCNMWINTLLQLNDVLFFNCEVIFSYKSCILSLIYLLLMFLWYILAWFFVKYCSSLSTPICQYISNCSYVMQYWIQKTWFYLLKNEYLKILIFSCGCCRKKSYCCGIVSSDWCWFMRISQLF